MTCVVGLVDGGRIVLGADSAGSNAYHLRVRSDEKVFLRGGFVFGFTTSFRMGQLIRYGGEDPLVKRRPPGEEEFDRYMRTEFVDWLRAVLKAGGWLEKDKEREEGGSFIVGYRGRLFEVHGDFQVASYPQPYVAVGSGGQVALGALHALSASGVVRAQPSAFSDELTAGELLSPEERLRFALEAAEAFCPGVRRPFHFVSLEPEEGT